ncbi:YdcF family protein [Paraclostridium ghonii]|uniref:Uncharacterized SAM-binding protein YcdF (DUF218 family) n=1 Tax=Paraclostridium ghonii TaxID=29358 RepID=A0ABU0N0M4_9FIRM|nr:YdcF family protein [Paeniclostridium ghonii]MDQ0556705.1 uncharacterized SAM-binding protein YcdF (DUF218 family) [Paeniclostridium ghonii]
MFKYIDILVGVLGIGYFIYLELFYGGMVFASFFLVTGIFLILYHFLKGKLGINKKLKKFIKIIITVGLSIFLIIEAILIFFPKNNMKDKCEYLIILGASVKNNTPSLTLKGRLDKAIKYLDESDDECYIVVSGGKGSDKNLSEAKVMENYLVEHGINKSKIIVEDKSTNTYENFKYSKEKIEEKSDKSIKELNIKIVTTDFHSFRSFILAKANGYKNTSFYTSKSATQFVPVYYTREFFATIKTIMFDIVFNI